MFVLKCVKDISYVECTNGLELKSVVNDNIKLKFHGCYFEVKCW